MISSSCETSETTLFAAVHVAHQSLVGEEEERARLDWEWRRSQNMNAVHK